MYKKNISKDIKCASTDLDSKQHLMVDIVSPFQERNDFIVHIS